MSLQKFLEPCNVDMVIHHSPCNDGHASAACFYHYNNDIELYGLQPRDQPDMHRCKDKNIVLVDICFNIEVMLEMCKVSKKILVLDHHITSQKTMQALKFPEKLLCHFDMNKAGVHLAWNYLHPDTPVPDALHYIGLRDLWQHERNESALYFTTAFERPNNWQDWKPFIFGNKVLTNAIVSDGRPIFNYQQHVLKQMMEKVEYTTWRGYTMAIVNVPFPWISDIGKLMCEQDAKNTVAVIWQKTVTSKYTVSLRSNDTQGPDVSVIAQEFGGGGHVHSAAFALDQPPFEILK